MTKQLSWKVGGQQGEGIESTGEIFSIALNRLGYYLFGYRHFSSRIKGGHTNNKIRVSTKPIHSISDDLDILVAFDQESIDLNFHELTETGVVLADSKFNPVIPDSSTVQLFSIPFTEIGSELGTSLMKNMVAVGATCALIGINVDIYQEVVSEIFSKKGATIIDRNIEAIVQGYKHLMHLINSPLLQLDKADGQKRMYMIGNHAIALGALAGGARFMPAYPITPASEIMEYLTKKLPDYGGLVIQTEDEIAACTMAIGGNYAGVRTLTASAGPGLSLMMEAIGLSGITETPLVIVNTQRGGPSTGLPTKQEQSDLMAMVYGTHGEIPKVVIAPSTVEEAFYDTVEAFNIAEEYQCPVIVLTDLALSLGKQTVEQLNYERIDIRRGKLLKESELPQLEGVEYFNRFAVTEDGISPRVLPGFKNGLHHVTGVEHNEQGKPSENPINRQKQMDKRLNKLNTLIKRFEQPIYFYAPHEKADLLLVGFNSTKGTIEETIERFEKDGTKVHHIQMRLIHPFPKEEFERLTKRANKIVVVENNATAQLANIIKANVTKLELESVLKYNGNPFLPSEIYEQCKELL